MAISLGWVLWAVPETTCLACSCLSEASWRFLGNICFRDVHVGLTSFPSGVPFSLLQNMDTLLWLQGQIKITWEKILETADTLALMKLGQRAPGNQIWKCITNQNKQPNVCGFFSLIHFLLWVYPNHTFPSLLSSLSSPSISPLFQIHSSSFRKEQASRGYPSNSV